MTPKILLEELQMFIAGKTKDMVLPAAVNTYGKSKISLVLFGMLLMLLL